MKFYNGEVDNRYIVSYYNRVGSYLFITYMDGETVIVGDETYEYESELRKKMVMQLRERNEAFEYNYYNKRKHIDYVALSSIYASLFAMGIKYDGDISLVTCIPFVLMGTWAIDRIITARGMLNDIDKTNMFLELYDNNLIPSDININNIDKVSYKEMNGIYKKVLKK